MATKSKTDETKKGKKKKPYRVAKKTYEYKELKKMSESELKTIKKLLRDNVTRNLRKLKRSGYAETPATIGLSKAVKSGIVSELPHLNATASNNALDVRTKLSKKQLLMGEIFELQKYQNTSTGTVSGMRKFENDTYERVGDAYKNSSKDTKLKFWELYDKQRERIEGNRLSSGELQKKLADYFIAKNNNNITNVDLKEWKKMVDETYDKEVAAEDGDNSAIAPSPFKLNT